MSVWSATADESPTAPERAACVLEVHGKLSGLGPYEPSGVDGVVHLLTDLMHLTASRGADFGAVVRAAQRHYVEERLRGPRAVAPVHLPAPA